MNQSLLKITPLPSGAWLPTQKAGLKKWFDPLQHTDLSGNLTEWLNQGTAGGNGDVQGTIPVVANSLNGKDSFQFDGSAGTNVNFDSTPSITQYIDPNSPFSVFWVFKGQTWTAGDEYFSLIHLNAGASAPTWGIYYVNPTSSLAAYPIIGIFNSQGGKKVFGNYSFTAYNSYHYVLINYDGTGDLNDPTKYEMYINGSAITIVDNNTLQGGTTLNGSNLLQTVDGFPDATDHRWVEFGLYDSRVDSGERPKFFGYMSKKYGL